MRNTAIIASIILALAVGFFAGRSSVTVKEKTVVQWKDMPTISVSVTPEPVRFTIPDVPKWLWRTDTINHIIAVDTAAILADWVLRREYAGRVVADSTGTIDYAAIIQYNQLQHIGIDFTPRQLTITTTKTVERRFTPFVFVGGNSAGFVSAEAGLFIGSIGIAADVGSNFNGTNYIGGRVGVKF